MSPLEYAMEEEQEAAADEEEVSLVWAIQVSGCAMIGCLDDCLVKASNKLTTLDRAFAYFNYRPFPPPPNYL